MSEAPRKPLPSIAFDCDSTLSAIEGIDEIARSHRERIEELTARAMSGEVALEDVYGARLEIAAPTFQDVWRVAELYVERLTPGTRRCVRLLHALGKEVLILSGGVRQAVARVARELAIPGERVFAVELYFDRDGRYQGFDEHSRLTRQGGKRDVLRSLRGEGRGTALVGDGMTDLECASLVDRFVGFGGIVERAPVKRASPHYVSTRDLRATLPFLLTAAERRAVLEKPELSALVDGIPFE